MNSYFVVFFTATVKFLIAPFVGINGYGLTIYETFIAVSLGGISSATFFYFLGNTLVKISKKRRIKKLNLLKKEGKELPKIMTRTNKLIIKTKHLFGIWGLAFLTAALISIPVGSIICSKFYQHKRDSIFIIYFFILVNALIASFLASLIPSFGG